MHYVRYVIWYWLSNDERIALSALIGALCLSGLVWFSTKKPDKPNSGLLLAALLTLVSAPLFWWFLVHLVDTKTPIRPEGFEFVEDLGRDIASCAHVNENPLIIRVTFCGIRDKSFQDRILADVQKANRYNGEKPIVVTFRTNFERHERALESGGKALWSSGGIIVRQKMLTPTP